MYWPKKNSYKRNVNGKKIHAALLPPTPYNVS